MYFAYFVVFSAALVFAQNEIENNTKTVQENELITKAKYAQSAIEDSIAKIKSNGASEDRVKIVTDNAFDDYVKYTKKRVSSILEKVNQVSDENSEIKTKLVNWIEGLESLNYASSTPHTAQDSLAKFENTIKKITESTGKFVEKLDSASPQQRDVLLEIGSFVNDAIERLTINVKGVESELENNTRVVQENELVTKVKYVQGRVEESIKKINSYGASEIRIKFVADNAFSDFVKYIKKRATSTIEKLDQTSSASSDIKTKLTEWIEGLERLNKSSVYGSAQDSLAKFETTIKIMSENTVKFAETFNSAPPQLREILLVVGGFMNDAIDRLAVNVAGVDDELKKST